MLFLRQRGFDMADGRLTGEDIQRRQFHQTIVTVHICHIQSGQVPVGGMAGSKTTLFLDLPDGLPQVNAPLIYQCAPRPGGNGGNADAGIIIGSQCGLLLQQNTRKGAGGIAKAHQGEIYSFHQSSSCVMPPSEIPRSLSSTARGLIAPCPKRWRMASMAVSSFSCFARFSRAG